jgi:hypothetical protein
LLSWASGEDADGEPRKVGFWAIEEHLISTRRSSASGRGIDHRGGIGRAPGDTDGVAVDPESVSISVVIPALDETANLPHVLTRIPSIVGEVLLVDGHSEAWPGPSP